MPTGSVTPAGGGGASTLAQVLATGRDQNGVLITNTAGGPGGFDLGDNESDFDVSVTGGHPFNPLNMGASTIRFKLSDWFFTTFLADSATGKHLIQLGEHDLDEALFGASGGKLGFYGTAGIVRGTLTSGTATPEQITLALQALGLVGGS
jgi:hypothetical protein